MLTNLICSIGLEIILSKSCILPYVPGASVLRQQAIISVSNDQDFLWRNVPLTHNKLWCFYISMYMYFLFPPPEEEPEKPTFGKKDLNWEEDMQLYSKFLDRKVRRSTVELVSTYCHIYFHNSYREHSYWKYIGMIVLNINRYLSSWMDFNYWFNDRKYTYIFICIPK